MNEKILIVGGSSGIEMATAQVALDKNYDVIIASRSIDKLEKAKRALNHKNVNAHEVDTRDEKSIAQLFQSIGKINHLVITGSEVQFGNIRNSTTEDAKNSFDSKFFGPFRMIKEALNFIESNGSITLFSGAAGAKPRNGTEILSAINGAVDSFSRALAISLSPIRVNS